MGEVKKVLCPVDLTAGAPHTAEEAGSLAKTLGAELILLHVMGEPAFAIGDPMVPPGDVAGSGYALPTLAEEYRVELERRLERLAEQVRESGVSVSTRLVRGATYETIVSTAEDEHADLIVMGTHGRKGLGHLLLGSVAERVVRTSKVPVMTLRQQH